MLKSLKSIIVVLLLVMLSAQYFGSHFYFTLKIVYLVTQKKCQWQIGMNKSYEPFRTRFQTHPKCFCRPLWVKSDEMCTHAARLYWEMLLLPTSLKGAPLLYFEDWKILRSTLSCKPDRVYVIRGNKYLSFRTISSTISTIKKIAGILIEWKRHKSHIVLP